jgi:GT2 family glycosyltransferase
MTRFNNQVSVVILTYNRAHELRRTLEKMRALPEQPKLIVVDNASTDDTCAIVQKEFPEVELIRRPENTGAAARNHGVRAARTPYVAFCDDDSWWAPGALSQAAAVLDANPVVAAVCAKILLGPQEKVDPVCDSMAASPLPQAQLPGPSLLGFVACAVVFRRQAYLDAGGYEAKFFVGGEEELLALDLLVKDWRIVYLDDLIVHHHPSSFRDNGGRQRIVIRNALWVAWMRLPFAVALNHSVRILGMAHRRKVLLPALLSAVRELPWVMRMRRVLPADVLALYRTLRG